MRQEFRVAKARGEMRRKVSGISKRELTRELAYLTIDPPEDEKIVAMLAQICSLIYNANSKKGSTKKPRHFIPDWDQELGQQIEKDDEYWTRHFQAFASQLGAEKEEDE